MGKASVLRSGTDVTVAALSRMVVPALEAADALADEGISVEVVDLRGLVPLDVETLVESVKKTSRLIVVHEAVEQGGVGAEVAARVQEEAALLPRQPDPSGRGAQRAGAVRPAAGEPLRPRQGTDRGGCAPGIVQPTRLIVKRFSPLEKEK